MSHYSDVIMNAMASQITGVSIAYSAVCSGADQRKHQSSTSLAFVRGIHRWPVNSPHKGPVTRKMFPFNDVIMKFLLQLADQQDILLGFWQKNDNGLSIVLGGSVPGVVYEYNSRGLSASTRGWEQCLSISLLEQHGDLLYGSWDSSLLSAVQQPAWSPHRWVGQNGRHFGRRQFQMPFFEWKW